MGRITLNCKEWRLLVTDSFPRDGLMMMMMVTMKTTKMKNKTIKMTTQTLVANQVIILDFGPVYWS